MTGWPGLDRGIMFLMCGFFWPWSVPCGGRRGKAWKPGGVEDTCADVQYWYEAQLGWA